MAVSLESKQRQDFLDKVQYNLNGVRRYEWIFGETFLSTGGLETSKKVLEKVVLSPGSRVLDIGSGIGGSSFLIAEKYKAFVHGIDLSRNMMSVAFDHLSRRPNLQPFIRFEIKDVLSKTADMPENYYDLVYSRDAFLHIEDKNILFKKIFKWLKPGGKVVFTDYARGDKKVYSEEFNDYLRHRQYHLLTRDSYQQVLCSNGFNNVIVKDWGHVFRESLERELKELNDRKEEFLSKFSHQDFLDLDNGWRAKLKRFAELDQGWILATAEKPDTIQTLEA
jgi:phosphoethanolamine N-methyltransferase